MLLLNLQEVIISFKICKKKLISCCSLHLYYDYILYSKERKINFSNNIYIIFRKFPYNKIYIDYSIE